MKRTCTECKKEKLETEFYGKHYKRCKPCHSKVVKQNQKQKADYYNNYRNEFSKKNPDKRTRWQKATRANWQKNHGMDYNKYARYRIKQRMKNDPEYRNKISEQNKKRYQKEKEKCKKYRELYYQKNRVLLLLKAKIRRYNKRFDIVDDRTKKEYMKRIQSVKKQINKLNRVRLGKLK